MQHSPEKAMFKNIKQDITCFKEYRFYKVYDWNTVKFKVGINNTNIPVKF